MLQSQERSFLIKSIQVPSVISADKWVNWCSDEILVDLFVRMPPNSSNWYGRRSVQITCCGVDLPEKRFNGSEFYFILEGV